jgi:hypothetical protein
MRTPHRFYYAFSNNALVNVIKNTSDGVMIVGPMDDEAGVLLCRLNKEDKKRCFPVDSIYDDGNVTAIIYAANKPDDKTWAEWLGAYSGEQPHFVEKLIERNPSAFSTLVLLNHPYRTKNLRKILAETRLSVVSSSEWSGKDPGDADNTQLYGRPEMPDFYDLPDETHELYFRDNIHSLDDLIPVYDFSPQSFSLNDVMVMGVEPRKPLVSLKAVPMLWSESINEVFAWRGTGKTLFSLSLALHLAAGRDFARFTIPEAKRVLYVEGELPASQLKERIVQLSQGLHVPTSNWKIRAKAFQEQHRLQNKITINTPEGREAIEAAIDEIDAQVVFLDSIASLAQISTNDELQWIPIIEWLVELRCKGIAVVYLQQSGKGGEQRGHSVSEDRIDLAIHLTAIKKNFDGAAVEMTFTKQREGSLQPIRMKCPTGGQWDEDDEKPARGQKKEKVEKPEELSGAGRVLSLDGKIAEALKAGESQNSIVKRFGLSKTTVNKVNKSLNAVV